MVRSSSVKNLVQYFLFGVIVIIAYRMFAGSSPDREPDERVASHQDKDAHHPRNVHAFDGGDTLDEMDRKWAGVKDVEMDRVEQRKKGLTDEEGVEELKDGIKNSMDEMKGEELKREPKMDVGDMPKDLQADRGEDLMARKAQNKLMMEMKQQAVKGFRSVEDRKPFLADGIDWALEEEMKKRRAAFFKKVEEKSEDITEDDFKNMIEDEETFPFVTAGSHTTYPATLEFIYSIQYFYPDSQISIYDIGLTSDEREFIGSLCNTEVESLWISFWPEGMYKIRHRVWRPTVLQFAMAKHGHFVYIEPGRFIYKQRIRDYIRHSLVHGVTVGGKQYKHSPVSVTNPHMYTFLSIDERKLQKIPHFDFTLMIMHNTNRVRHYFVRYLLACIMEEYCIAPPGSKSNCDRNLELSRKYANCHRYDESAINLILNKWHNYKTDEFLMQDLITRHFDGKDVVKKLKVCNKHKEGREEV